MNYTLSYQHKNLIYIGLIEIFFLNLYLFVFYIFIKNDLYISLFFEILLILITFALLEPIILYLGVSEIIKGKKEIRLRIDNTYIRKYENKKLKREILTNDIRKIIYIYPETLKWRTIVFTLLNKKGIKITISEKKELPKVEEFLKFLTYYSKKYNIPFEEKKIETLSSI